MTSYDIFGGGWNDKPSPWKSNDCDLAQELEDAGFSKLLRFGVELCTVQIDVYFRGGATADRYLVDIGCNTSYSEWILVDNLPSLLELLAKIVMPIFQGGRASDLMEAAEEAREAKAKALRQR